jgi:hypothetical protein
MISSGGLSASQMAKAAASVPFRESPNIRALGSVKAPPNKAGRPPGDTPIMLESLCGHLLENPNLYLDEMRLFRAMSLTSRQRNPAIVALLHPKIWSKKKPARVKARERNLGLRDEYFHFTPDFDSYHLVYVNESGRDKRTGFRRTGWSRLVRPQFTYLNTIITSDIRYCRVLRGSTDAHIFEKFIEGPRRHCGRWPEPKPVLVMGNASFHHSEWIRQLCSDAGVKLVYLPLYSPDLNPIDEFFAELK